MKNFLVKPTQSILHKATMVLAGLLFSLISVAQDKQVDVNVNTKSGSDGNFFTQPWVWIVGGAVFLLLLVALLRNNNSRS